MVSNLSTQLPSRPEDAGQGHPGELLDRVQLMFTQRTCSSAEISAAMMQLCETLDVYFAHKEKEAQLRESRSDEISSVDTSHALRHRHQFLLDRARAVLQRVQQRRQSKVLPDWWVPAQRDFEDMVEHLLEYEADDYNLLIQGRCI